MSQSPPVTIAVMNQAPLVQSHLINTLHSFGYQVTFPSTPEINQLLALISVKPMPRLIITSVNDTVDVLEIRRVFNNHHDAVAKIIVVTDDAGRKRSPLISVGATKVIEPTEVAQPEALKSIVEQLLGTTGGTP
jgi:SpoU rRNA methylase family enzyme